MLRVNGPMKEFQFAKLLRGIGKKYIYVYTSYVGSLHIQAPIDL